MLWDVHTGEDGAVGGIMAGAKEAGRDLAPPKEKERLRSPKFAGLPFAGAIEGKDTELGPLSISSFAMEAVREWERRFW